MRIATIGMFDGVHRGHQAVLEELRQLAASKGAEPMAFSFTRHPAAVLRPDKAPRLLTDVTLRSDLVRSHGGIERLEFLDMNREDFRATAAEFAAMLRQRHGIDALLMGFNNHLGSDRLTARELAQVCGDSFGVYEAKPLNGDEFTSTAARHAVERADLAAAENILGHRFTVRGRVVPGKQLGRTIGFPTANIEALDPRQLLPPDGVYAVAAHIDGIVYPAMANIGTRPSVAPIL